MPEKMRSVDAQTPSAETRHMKTQRLRLAKDAPPSRSVIAFAYVYAAVLMFSARCLPLAAEAAPTESPCWRHCATRGMLAFRSSR
jgi:hypothetical protein